MSISNQNPILQEAIVDLIDEAILELRLVTNERELRKNLYDNLMEILTFLKKARGVNYQNLLFEKNIYIEQMPLEIVHSKMKDNEFTEDLLDDLMERLTGVYQRKIIDVGFISQIQIELMQLSFPFWQSLNK